MSLPLVEGGGRPLTEEEKKLLRLMKPLRIYVHETKVWHQAFTKYFKTYSISDGEARVGFEDLDETVGPYKPDWDYDEPVLTVKLVGENKPLIRIEGYGGILTVDLYYGDTLLVGNVKEHVGEEFEVEVREEAGIPWWAIALGVAVAGGGLFYASLRR